MMIFVHIWKWFTRALFLIGTLLGFLVLVELLRVFVFLRDLHPVAGWTYACVLLAGALACSLYVIRELKRYPRVLAPPTLPALPEEATHAELKRYTKYLITYGQRLLRNTHLTQKEREPLHNAIESISSHLQNHPLNDDLIRFIQQMDTDVLPPLLNRLRDLSEKEIRRSVRDVMLGVTLSPYHSIDILIVLYRNVTMILRIISIYETTPVPRAQWRILRDVVRVIATVNFLYVGRNLVENLFAFVPWVGRMADDIGQGLGAGLFTSAAGHAAIDRCATYQQWEKSAAAESLAAQSRDFLRDVRNIFTKDVLPDIKNRIISQSPESVVQEPGFWEKIQKGINNAFDATMRAAGGIFPLPASQPRIEMSQTPPGTDMDNAGLIRSTGRSIKRKLKRLWPFGSNQ